MREYIYRRLYEAKPNNAQCATLGKRDYKLGFDTDCHVHRYDKIGDNRREPDTLVVI